MISELFDIELVAYPRAERDDERVELVIAVYLIGSRLLDVEHFAPHGKYCLKARVAPLYRGACSAVALDDVYLAQRRVTLVAVLKLIGHLPALKPGLAADGLLGLSRGLARAVCHHRLFEYGLGRRGMLLKIYRQLVVHDRVYKRSYIGVAELLLGLSLKLRLRQLHGYDRRDALAHIVAGDLIVALDDVVLLPVGVYDSRERGLEARLVHAAFGGVYVVCEGDEIFAISVVILQGYLGYRVALLAGEIDNVLMYRRLVLVEPCDEFLYAAVIAHYLRLLPALALILHRDGEAAVQECLLAQPCVQRLIVVYRVVEHLRVGLEAHGGTRSVRRSYDVYAFGDAAAGELHLIYFAVPVHLYLKPLGQSVDDRRADAMQTAGDLVAPAAELAARVQHGEHDLKRTLAGLLLNIDRDAAAVIAHADDVALFYRHGDAGAEARQSLVDGVVDDLIHKVMQTRQ